MSSKPALFSILVLALAISNPKNTDSITEISTGWTVIDPITGERTTIETKNGSIVLTPTKIIELQSDEELLESILDEDDDED